MFRKVLIANRGAIACRIIRTLRCMGVGSVAVYSEADRFSLHVSQADEAVCIGPAQAAQSYLSADAILAAALRTGAEAIHPGYGFLSENAEFAEACAAAGVVFIGPAPEQMRAFGLKHTARQLAKENGVPLLPGTGLLADVEEAAVKAAAVGYPVMLKSTAGGGGIGMRVCLTHDELLTSFAAVERLSKANFGQSGIYLEKFVSQARHIEVQLFGDGAGTVIALGERDCSAQRRHQKVIEETPAPGLPEKVRAKLLKAAVRLGRAVNYASAGTVEFIYDAATEEFYFLEVNTRLQVEHGVTEEVTGVDLVEWMVLQAAGELPLLKSLQPMNLGHSLQVRVYAENPGKNFQPSAGKLIGVEWPASARIEAWVEPGTEITPFYDPMLAKIIVKGADRSEALARMRQALAGCRLAGITTNLDYLRAIIADPNFIEGGITTAFLGSFVYHPQAVEVIAAGTQSTIQDYPGRLGYWHVGVPPSGPMDALAFRLANRLAGNSCDAAALEMTLTGPTLRFASEAVIALTGADMGATLDGAAVPRWQAVPVKAGATLLLGAVQGPGSRAYLAVSGGFDIPAYLGSQATFILGGFGGHAGRVLRAGDVLPIGIDTQTAAADPLTPELRPRYGNEWRIGVLYGPHGAPDFFTDTDIEMFFSTAWKVHYNSDRTGVRLIGPKPQWARKDGGEAGLHPSNLHDNAYAIGTIDFTGDMPVILGPDGPSLGGFVCPATIVQAELWKIGQLKPGDSVSFHRLTLAQAREMEEGVEQGIATLTGSLPTLPASGEAEPAVLKSRPNLACRADGDRNLLIEYGPNVLSLDLRFRAHALELEVRRANIPGIIDLTPGVRSLQIHYDSRVLPREQLLTELDRCEAAIGDASSFAAPSRVVHLPLSWDDPATQLAIQKYMQSVRPDAPWCPSNIEFIRRINGLDSIEDVYHTVFNASYLVLGLGDVYLGAPVATPTDPRHRLVTTKYNPARTWTPENAVGIGGAYLCIYGMEGPGGYQFVGRTLQMWNTYKSTAEFVPGTPWLLRFFDQIRYYAVSAQELLEIRKEFPHGGYPLKIEEGEFRLREHQRFLASISTEAAQWKQRQQQAFEAERERWAAAGKAEFMEPTDAPAPSSDAELPPGCSPVPAPITASVWQIEVKPGQPVEAGQRLLVLEAMKMEIAVTAPHRGVVERLHCAPGAMVMAGQQLAALRREDA